MRQLWLLPKKSTHHHLLVAYTGCTLVWGRPQVQTSLGSAGWTRRCWESQRCVWSPSSQERDQEARWYSWVAARTGGTWFRSERRHKESHTYIRNLGWGSNSCNPIIFLVYEIRPPKPFKTCLTGASFTLNTLLLMYRSLDVNLPFSPLQVRITDQVFVGTGKNHCYFHFQTRAQTG